MATWDEIYAGGVVPVPDEPEPWLVSWVPLLLSAGVRRVLDLGCGAGRHVVHLGLEGFDVVGVDPSAVGLGHARTRAEAKDVPARLAVGDMHALPFAEDAFDAVVSIHVLYHTDRAGMARALGEVRRVLRPGGPFLATLLSTRTWKYGRGERVEEHTYVQPTGPEAGVLHHYCDEAEARVLLRGLDVRHLELDEVERGSGEPGIHSHWTVIAWAI